MSFLIKDDEVWDKYDKIWDVIKNKLGINFQCEPVDGVIKTRFSGNDVPKENMHYTCIACITIDSVMRIDKKNHPQVYLEECKYKIKKIQMSKFIDTELKSDSNSELDSDLDSGKVGAKFDAELMAKLKSGSDNDSEENIIAYKWLQIITNKNDSHKQLQIKVIVTNDYK